MKLNKLILICLFLFMGGMVFAQTEDNAMLKKTHSEKVTQMRDYIEIMANPMKDANTRMRYCKTALSFLTDNASIIVASSVASSDSKKIIMAKDYFMRISTSNNLFNIILVDCAFADDNKISLMCVCEVSKKSK